MPTPRPRPAHRVAPKSPLPIRRIAATPVPRTAPSLAAQWGALLGLLLGLTAASASGAEQAQAQPAPHGAATWPTFTVQRQPAHAHSEHEGVVEAVRQTTLAAQVAGRLLQGSVRAGDAVQAGQVLARIDARDAHQGSQASQAQAAAVLTQAELAQTELARQQQLFAKGYLSQAALDQARARAQAAQAQARAAQAQARAAGTQTDHFVLRAPYAGIVSRVDAEWGDMVMPGRPLLTLHDPRALRVVVAVPEALGTPDVSAGRVRIVLGTHEAAIAPTQVQWLPTTDPATHTRQLRLMLPAGTRAAPGGFARVSLSGPPVAGSVAAASATVRIPAQALVRRGEVTAAYVLSAQGQPLLRLLKLGRAQDGEVEVLSGLDAGERVVADPAQVLRAVAQRATAR